MGLYMGLYACVEWSNGNIVELLLVLLHCTSMMGKWDSDMLYMGSVIVVLYSGAVGICCHGRTVIVIGV